MKDLVVLKNIVGVLETNIEELEEFVNTFKLSKSAYDYEFTEIEKPDGN